ncbi:Fur family transcriptional regulator [Peribacillus sp. V2I11]|uniref:Fur family transcriptional regulator n=1 Tax=Peribacillus sp. V2I11 TaxID=3042277 RepID=UPI0027851061|nr:Fur family transcriptional regulator [Peribacillus sp. V2I11]MDQ0879211.1 Fur family zinc uptake transcriptional regulator [Peribacillus sp. V2I11]
MNLELYLDHIKDNGYRCTPQRSNILSYFIGQKNRFVTAKSVTDHLRNTMGYVSFDTVYRNLYLFKDIGIMDLTSQGGENLFHLKNEINTHEHKFICTECGNTTELNLCPMEIMDTSLNDYLIYDHKFEVYGFCPSCL